MNGVMIDRIIRQDKVPNGASAPVNRNIANIKGRVSYFSLTGDLAIQAFKEHMAYSPRTTNKDKQLKHEIIARLQFAIMMFDIVVMHCSDPLRNKIVLEILEDYSDWISEGKIAFVFSNSIQEIRSDYQSYILRKIKEYEDGYCCEKEIESLKQAHIDENYYERVIDVLSKTKYMVRKTTVSRYKFDRLVKNDLKRNAREVIVDTKPSERTDIQSMNYSLYQLLKLRCPNQRSNKLDYVFPDEITDEIINSVRERLEQGSKIARSVIITELYDRIQKKMTQQQKDVIDAITMRMDVLYCQMNSGERLVLESHPVFEKQSAYQMRNYRRYLGKIKGSKVEGSMRIEHFRKLMKIEKEEVDSFRLLFLACVADAQERMILQSEEDAFDIAMEDHQVSKIAQERFPNIKTVLLEELLK